MTKLTGRPAKLERNEHLVKLRNENPELYSFGKLGEIFKISKVWAFEIYRRETERMKKVAKKGVKVIHSS